MYMYRPLCIAAFVLLLVSLPVAAQRGGGGHVSGGGHGGFSGHASFGGHAFGGMHSGSGFAGHSFGRSSAFARGFSRSSRGPLSPRGFNRSGIGLRIRTRGFRNNCYGYGCGWGYGYPYLGGGVDPYWWWDSDSSDSGPDPYQQYDDGLANQMTEQGIYPRRAPDRSDQDIYARSAPPPPRQDETTTPAPATMLVFRDQHKQEVQNYAIVGQTLWIFNTQRTQKIPLAEVDIDATEKANADRGVDFRVPGTEAGQ